MIAPTGALTVSIIAIAFASVGYVLTAHPGRVEATPISAHAPKATATPKPTQPKATATVAPTHAPAVDRTAYRVVVFNNSNVKGLAARTATRAQQAGWKVTGQDNWYGTISSSTVYYPATMKRAAGLLAHDLGIGRVMPSVTPMSTSQLTVILTADYSG
jgi:hypothetical protein